MATTLLDRLMVEEFQAQPLHDRQGADFVLRNGRIVIVAQVKLQKRGVREIRDSLLQMASYLALHEGQADQGYVIISLTRMSASRIHEEWRAAQIALRPDIANRLHLVATLGSQIVAEPNDQQTQELASRFRRVVERLEGPQKTPQWHTGQDWPGMSVPGPASASWRHLEIEKLLLCRWLLNEAPIAIGDLQDRVGCSYPTVQRVIHDLNENGLVQRTAGRSVRLAKYPTERWSSLIALEKKVYRPLEFVDPTSIAASAVSLIDRLRRLNASSDISVALGGVEAARYWDPSFDLNGLPRIDLVFHSSTDLASMNAGQDLVRRLDPGLVLRQGEQKHRSAILVIHPLFRRDSLFKAHGHSGLPWAAPVETILHLHEMGLVSQAGDLVTHLLSRSRKE